MLSLNSAALESDSGVQASRIEIETCTFPFRPHLSSRSGLARHPLIDLLIACVTIPTRMWYSDISSYTMTPLEVEAIFQNSSQYQYAGSSSGSLQLQPALEAAQQLWYSGSPDIDAIAQKLGDGSRDGETCPVIP